MISPSLDQSDPTPAHDSPESASISAPGSESTAPLTPGAASVQALWLVVQLAALALVGLVVGLIVRIVWPEPMKIYKSNLMRNLVVANLCIGLGTLLWVVARVIAG